MASHQFDNVGRSSSVSGPPSGGDYAIDRGFRGIAWLSAALILALVVYIIIEIGGKALPVISKYALGFLTSTKRTSLDPEGRQKRSRRHCAGRPARWWR